MLESLDARFARVVGRADLRSACHKDSVRTQVLAVLDCFCGVVDAAAPNNSCAIFSFLLPKLQLFPDILGEGGLPLLP